jgi:hypothetical protein
VAAGRVRERTWPAVTRTAWKGDIAQFLVRRKVSFLADSAASLERQLAAWREAGGYLP